VMQTRLLTHRLPGNIPIAMNRVIMAAKSVPTTSSNLRCRRQVSRNPDACAKMSTM